MSVGNLIRYGLPFANVVPSGTATNNITPGRTLELITLGLGGTALTKAMIESVRIKANGKVIIDGSAVQLDALNKYRGDANDAAYLDIPFADRSMLSEFDRAVSAFDTSMGVGNITTEIKIVGATAPVLTPILTESASQKTRDGVYAPFAGLFRKVLSYPFNIANGGKLPMVVPFGPQNGSIIMRLHVFHGGNMTAGVVKQDAMPIREFTKAENEYLQKRHGRVPQANVFTFDFVVDGNIAKALDTRTAKSLEWIFEFSAADSGVVLVEYLDTLGNL